MKKGMNEWERWFWRSEMKVKCTYYRPKQQPSKRLSKGQVLCIHPHSLQIPGADEKPASCEGDRDKCDIPKGKRFL